MIDLEFEVNLYINGECRDTYIFPQDCGEVAQLAHLASEDGFDYMLDDWDFSHDPILSIKSVSVCIEDMLSNFRLDDLETFLWALRDDKYRVLAELEMYSEWNDGRYDVQVFGSVQDIFEYFAELDEVPQDVWVYINKERYLDSKRTDGETILEEIWDGHGYVILLVNG